MKPYPEERSILIVDNYRVHRNKALVEIIESAGLILFDFSRYFTDVP